jgi:hypothetical protein
VWGITEMSNLQEWINAALLVAEAEGMANSEVIPTWPADCVERFPDRFPQLTVGALREWQAASAQDGGELIRYGIEWVGPKDPKAFETFVFRGIAEEFVENVEEVTELLLGSGQAPNNIVALCADLTDMAHRAEAEFKREQERVAEPFGTESAYQAAKNPILSSSNMIISSGLVRDLVEALRKADTQQPSAVVPDGRKLVPVEPTPEMREAFFGAQEECETFKGRHGPAMPDHQWAAMLAAAPQQPAQGQWVPTKDTETRWILGRPCFVCAGIAQNLRAKGYEIERKAEDEQAVVIDWMLSLYAKHGPDWRSEAESFLVAPPEQEQES